MARLFFPMFVDLNDRRVLVVGAGGVAARRVKVLCDFCGHIRVVAPRVCEAIDALQAEGRVAVVRRAFEDRDLDGADVVLAATDDAELNARIAGMCRAGGVPVNVASDRALCDFFFPGVATSGSVVAGVSACGEDHELARIATGKVRACLENIPKPSKK